MSLNTTLRWERTRTETLPPRDTVDHSNIHSSEEVDDGDGDGDDHGGENETSHHRQHLAVIAHPTTTSVREE